MNGNKDVAYSYRQDGRVPAFPDDKPLFVFDGVCVLCSGGAAWLMRRDKRSRFRYTSAQSPLGQALYEHYGVALDETYLLVDGGRVFGKSDGYLRMARILGGGWSLVKVFRLMPRSIRDVLYDVIARHRYQWFGRTECCKLIPEDLRQSLL
jgi:predicted DCC family thiol-disulfide oxidoreductase YuxK